MMRALLTAGLSAFLLVGAACSAEPEPAGPPSPRDMSEIIIRDRNLELSPDSVVMSDHLPTNGGTFVTTP